MAKQVPNDFLKYRFREIYTQNCERTGQPIDFDAFYKHVSALCTSHPSRIARLARTRRNEVRMATAHEMEAFSKVLGVPVASFFSDSYKPQPQ